MLARSRSDFSQRAYCAASANGGCESHWVNAAPYYRCRFPAEYALANREGAQPEGEGEGVGGAGSSNMLEQP